MLAKMERIKKSFNKAAYTYNENNDFQQIVGKELLELLLECGSDYADILELGCGTGSVSELFVDVLHYDSYLGLDIAEKMVELAKERLQSSKAKFVVESFDQLNVEPSKYELIFSNLALHWSCDMQKLLSSIYRALKTKGVFLFSIPTIGTFYSLDKALRTVSKPTSQQFIDKHVMLDTLQSIGFNIINYKTNGFTYYFDDMICLLKTLKNTGTNIATNPSVKGLQGRRLIHELSSVYGQSCNESQLPLTYKITYFIAEK